MIVADLELPGEVEAPLQVCLVLLPRLLHGRPEIFMDSEHVQQHWIVDNFVDRLQGHVVHLKSALKHFSFGFRADHGLAFLIPVRINLTIGPVQGRVVVVVKAVSNELGLVIGPRFDDLPFKIRTHVPTHRVGGHFA